MSQNGDMSQVRYWGSTIRRWRVNLTAVSRFLLGTRELLHSLCKEEKPE